MNHFSRPVKQSYFKVGLFFYLALLLGGAHPAGAAVASASAAIDWSTFKVTPIDTGQGLPTLIWRGQGDESQANLSSRCCDMFDFASNWSTGTSASASRSNFNASASTSESQLKADASINGFPNQISSALGVSQRGGGFTVQGSGRLLFQANYSLAGDVDTTPGISGGPSVGFRLFSFDESGNFIDEAGQNFGRGISSGDQPFTEVGILSTALNFQNGWKGDLSTSAGVLVSGVTPVPLPAAFWLFGSALAGVAALRRLKRPATCKG